MNAHEPPMEGEDRQQSKGDPREERLQALYTAAYLPLEPSAALEQRVARITAQPGIEPARSGGRRQQLPAWRLEVFGTRVSSPRFRATLSLGAAGAGSFLATLLAALLLSSAAARDPARFAAPASVVRQESPELQARRAVWLSDPAPSLLPFPVNRPQEDQAPPRAPQALPIRRSQQRDPVSTT